MLSGWLTENPWLTDSISNNVWGNNRATSQLLPHPHLHHYSYSRSRSRKKHKNPKHYCAPRDNNNNHHQHPVPGAPALEQRKEHLDPLHLSGAPPKPKPQSGSLHD